MAGLIVVSVLSFCVVNGRRLEDQRIQVNSSRGQVAYGKSLVQLRLPTANSHTVSLITSKDNWTLMVFVQTTCPACADELRCLIRVKNQLPQLHILPVIEGNGSIDASTEVGSLVAQLSDAPAFDPDGSIYRICGNAEVTPYAVLVDSQARIRFTSAGHSATSTGGSELTDALKSFFTEETSSHPLTKWQRLSALPNRRFSLSNGKQTDLNTLSERKVLVVTALMGNDVLSQVRIKSLRPFFKAPNLQFLFVPLSPAAQLIVPEGMPKVSSTQARVVSQFLSVKHSPSSQIIYRGRQLAIEEGEQSQGSIRQFDQELSYAALLSDAKWFRSQQNKETRRNATAK